MEFNNLLLEKDGAIGIITMNRPKALNALNEETLVDLDQAVDLIAKDDEVKAVIITGNGNAFVAGADIVAMQNNNGLQGKAFGTLGQGVFLKIEKLPKPVIAAINGFALGGGCELAMACDIRIASEKAKFGQPEVGLGIVPGFAGTQRLPKLVGAGMAKELIFTGDMIDAQKANQIGLVNRVVAPDELMEEAKKMARKIISNAPVAVRFAKQAINEGLELDVARGQLIEVDLLALCFATEDQKEGMKAFIEKRKPVFKDR
ncbi:MAG: short-chain-enoyl-CoA hydratase [Syntrophomonadaceae bacterium]|nr:short-chain-enoyl-CoA hydratase [Syntrophomonadaceae bacterium]